MKTVEINGRTVSLLCFCLGFCHDVNVMHIVTVMEKIENAGRVDLFIVERDAEELEKEVGFSAKPTVGSGGHDSCIGRKYRILYFLPIQKSCRPGGPL